ncbi:MAG: hypothetical protein IJ838_00155 [Paludibacteraceae bacterium]|nr:hypothetical protein [Paludibacteraceae bacterium]
MKDFVIAFLSSVASSIVLGIIAYVVSIIGEPMAIWIGLAFIAMCSLVFGTYILVVNLRSKNKIAKLLPKGAVVGIEPDYEKVRYDGIPLLRPDYIKFIRKDGTKGIIHHSSVIIFV